MQIRFETTWQINWNAYLTMPTASKDQNNSEMSTDVTESELELE
jgi:hypothetical protein